MPFNNLIKRTLASSASPDEFLWLEEAIAAGYDNEKRLQMAFIRVPEKIKKTNLVIDPSAENEFISNMRFSPNGWPLHKLARVFILLHFQPNNEKKYVSALNSLFETGELNELDALYSSLSLLKYPDNWLHYAREAVRSNMGLVFDAIAFNNPYPSMYFDENAWNQMVMKTIFNGKNIQHIHGIRKRSNKTLAYMISDFAHERWAAGRSVPPQAWEMIAPFIDHHLILTVETLFQSENESDKNAAKLCCVNSDFESAKDLLKIYNNSLNRKNRNA